MTGPSRPDPGAGVQPAGGQGAAGRRLLPRPAARPSDGDGKQGECAEAALKPPSGAGGVYRITVFEDLAPAAAARRQLVPRAERLVYRRPAESLKLAVAADKPHYVPGDRVTLPRDGPRRAGPADAGRWCC